MTTLMFNSGFTKKDSTDNGPPALLDSDLDAEAKWYYYGLQSNPVLIFGMGTL
jgi:hypothetical protein